MKLETVVGFPITTVLIFQLFIVPIEKIKHIQANGSLVFLMHTTDKTQLIFAFKRILIPDKMKPFVYQYLESYLL